MLLRGAPDPIAIRAQGPDAGLNPSIAHASSGTKSRSDDRPAQAILHDVHRDLIDLGPELRAVLRQLTDAGGRPIVVGGAVRDALLKVPAKDIDIECYALEYGGIADALAGMGKVDLVGAAFGVLKFCTDELDLDISLPRRDSKVGSGHRGFDVEVDHTLTFVEASSRRDFTINAIGWDPATGEVLDPHGGRADLARGVLRHVSDAFADDPLRVLRGVQFAGRFDMVLDPQTADFCRSLVDDFEQLPIERVWGEWEKIASKAVRPSRSLQALRESGWLVHFPDLAAIDGVPQDVKWHPEGPVEIHTAESMDAAAAWCGRHRIEGRARTLAVLGALVHDFGKVTHTQIHPDGRITSHGHAEAGVAPANRFLRQIGAPEDIVARILPIVREHMCVACAPEAVTAAAVKRLSRRLSPATLEEWATVVEADHLGRGPASHAGITDRWLDLGREAGVQHQAPKPFLKGEMLMALGLKPGPRFKEIIAASNEAQDDGVIHDSESAATWAAGYVEASDDR